MTGLATELFFNIHVSWLEILVIWDLHIRVELEQFCKKQCCRELNSLQDGAISLKDP